MNNLDEVLHSTKQMVNEHRHAYPPVWYEDATKIIEQARAELAALRQERDASTLQLMDEIEMRHGIHEDRWGILREILAAAFARVDGEK